MWPLRRLRRQYAQETVFHFASLFELLQHAAKGGVDGMAYPPAAS